MSNPNPPAGCPMHVEPPADAPSCPMPKKEESPSCPMPKKEEKPTIPPGCPMHKAEKDELNKLNMIPNLSQAPQQDQKIQLPTERVISSIPKSKDDSAKWEYPSPQQFYNALRRKGWETPEEEIETMVDIHNFLNEEAWQEVLRWEAKYNDCVEDPYLSKFQGRPKEMTPKAKWHTFFGAPKPFDRHDWYISRCGQSRRYVIDYYEAPEDVPGVPVFHLDVRPALDDAESIMVRFKEAAKTKWEQWFPLSTPEPSS
ncbi:cytochrome c heme lyase [Gilbertella persicaria]|uniref:cytochrome c heme lyase n=1 Tax=Gilbertella persicaria TaxID=101096 RepID=UPI00221F52E0|nr:cytochrome c heme lyase [Gilbertella persicaria]KAI8061833.1 cytochrome c heme lyase [Gilbertella persicaria]